MFLMSVEDGFGAERRSLWAGEKSEGMAEAFALAGKLYKTCLEAALENMETEYSFACDASSLEAALQH